MQRLAAEAAAAQQSRPQPGPDGTMQASPQLSHAAPPQLQEPLHLRQAWTYLDEVVQILKTAFPLLILSLETMVEQLNTRFKATPEEEAYRLMSMLLHDAIQVHHL